MELTYVTRWNRVRMNRPQSVGEHTFRVLAILMELYEKLNLTAATAGRMFRYALIHDGPEAFTGDLPANFKRYVSEGQLRNMEESECPWYQQERLHTYGDERMLVEVADSLEAYTWACLHGAPEDVLMDVHDKLMERVQQYVARYGATNMFQITADLVAEITGKENANRKGRHPGPGDTQAQTPDLRMGSRGPDERSVGPKGNPPDSPSEMEL